MPNAYRYDPETLLFVGEVARQKDPLESNIRGEDVYLMPGNSTLVKPMDEKEGFEIKYNPETDEWIQQEISKSENIMPHIMTEEEIKESKREERNFLLSQTDKYMLGDFPITDSERQEYIKYRQYLRDIPNEEGFPNIEILSFEEWVKTK